jgi:AraC family transcriptional regulator
MVVPVKPGRRYGLAAFRDDRALSSIDGMPRSEILLHELASDDPVRLADDSSVAVSSAGAGWSGVGAELQTLPASDPPEGYMPWHLLSVQLSPPPLYEVVRGGRVRERRRLAPGDVILHPAGVPTQGRWNGASEVINVVVDPAAVARAASEGGAVPVENRYGPDPVVHHLAQALVGALANGGSGGALFADGVREALAGHLVARYGGAPRRPGGPRRLTAAELERVRARIHDELADDLRLADLAAAVPLSPHHFSRAFRETTGLTPHRYLMRCRAEAGRALLARTRLGLDEIARRTGFSDGAHLARQFRRQFGVTPGAFRAAVRG